MKLTAFILLIACLHVSAKGITQVTFSGKDVPLEKVFEAIKKQTGYSFLYNSDAIKKARPVTIDVKDMPVEEVLAECLRGQPFNFRVADRTIFILPKKNEVSSELIQNSQTVDLKQIDVTGRVVNEKGEPVSGVTVTIKSTSTITTTNTNGEFSLRSVDPEAVLIFTHVSMETFELKVSGKTDLAINLKTKISALGDVTVTVNTGYQKLPKERSTGAFGFVSNEEINRKAGPDILSRLEGVTTGVLFDRRTLTPNQGGIVANNVLIRGLNTLSEGMKAPLIVVDNFPYEGNINNINPNDVESITILKDAAAASIWGAKAGNGVIVITTKRGQFNQPFRLTLNSNIRIVENPDLFKYPRMSTSDFVDFEIFLFAQGYYDPDLGDPSYPALSPVVEILEKQRSGAISDIEANAQLNAFRQSDVRNDLTEYIYRKSVNTQYALNLTGGSSVMRYSISGGYDKFNSSFVGDNNRRLTLRSSVSLIPIKNMDINLGLAFANSKANNNSLQSTAGSLRYREGKNIYPYAEFADANGLALVMPKDYRVGYTDTAGAGKLLDWKYRPLDELRYADNSVKLEEVVFNLSLGYKITSFLRFETSYQYEHEVSTGKRVYSDKTFYARNLINLYTQILGDQITNTIPNAGILDLNHEDLTSHAGRAQFNIDKTWSGSHQVVGIIGAEIRERKLNSDSRRLYGFDPATYTSVDVDLVNQYPIYGDRGFSQVPKTAVPLRLFTDRFVSLYGNIAYTFNNKYTLSASARRDAANLFGVETNNRWKPLWTVGGAWNISNESFYKSAFAPYLRLRATYGYQGNVNNAVPRDATLVYILGSNINNIPSAILGNPANPELGWETLRQINVGVDFKIFRDRITGSVDAFTKRSKNLLWNKEIDPTSGLFRVVSNNASMTGKGVEVSIGTVNVKGKFGWNTEIGYSYVTNEVINYDPALDKGITMGSIMSDGISIVGLRGKSPFPIFSYPFAGLDPNTGDPLGYIGKSVSNDYIGMADQLYDTSLVNYHGSAVPTSYGFFNNIFSYKGFSLTVNINYRLGYYFRKNTINYYQLILSGQQHPDYASRWQAPGDESTTNIPSFIYPASDAFRDDFYARSSANVLKGDNIRLQNIRLAYRFGESSSRKMPFKGIQIYVNVENLCILWRANDQGLDPDYNTGNAEFPVPKVYTFGLNVNF